MTGTIARQYCGPLDECPQDHRAATSPLATAQPIFLVAQDTSVPVKQINISNILPTHNIRE